MDVTILTTYQYLLLLLYEILKKLVTCIPMENNLSFLLIVYVRLTIPKYALDYPCLCTLLCCIFRPAFGCCALQALVKLVILSAFCAKKLKNPQKFDAKSSKIKRFFEFAPKRWSTFYSPKNELFLLLYLVLFPNNLCPT